MFQPGRFRKKRSSLRRPYESYRKIEDQEMESLRSEAVQFKTVVQDLIELSLPDSDPLGISASDYPAMASYRKNALQIRKQIDSVKSAAEFTNKEHQTRRTLKNRMTNGNNTEIPDPINIEELQLLKNRCFAANEELNTKTGITERVIVDTTQRINSVNFNLETERSRFQIMYDERKKEYEVAKRKRKNEERIVREKLLQIQSLRRQEIQAARSINEVVEILDRYQPAFNSINELRRKHAELATVFKPPPEFSSSSIMPEHLDQDWNRYFSQFCLQWQKWDERHVVVWMKIVFGEEIITRNVQENIVEQGLNGELLKNITTGELLGIGIKNLKIRRNIVEQVEILKICSPIC